MTLPANIFNTDKTDYEDTPMFFGQKSGLYDSVNRKHHELFDLYKKLKRLDWDENDFSMKSCMVEFETASPEIVEAMITTIAFQWETDTVAARSMLNILSPFISATEVHTYYQRVSENEALHALAYSEIIRGSFRDPGKVISDILSRQSAQDRLQIVADVFEQTFELSHRYALGEVTYSQEAYNQLFKFIIALYLMESIQFMSSFAVTFAIARSGWFVPIGQTVQKICQDEFEIHVKGNQYVLDSMMRTSEGLTAFNACKGWIADLLSAVIRAEHVSACILLPEGKELVGLNAELLKSYINMRGKTCYDFFMLPTPEEFKCDGHPLAWMDDWTNINKTQGSPQEARQGAYFVGGVVDNLGAQAIDMDLG